MKRVKLVRCGVSVGIGVDLGVEVVVQDGCLLVPTLGVVLDVVTSNHVGFELLKSLLLVVR